VLSRQQTTLFMKMNGQNTNREACNHQENAECVNQKKNRITRKKVSNFCCWLKQKSARGNIAEATNRNPNKQKICAL